MGESYVFKPREALSGLKKLGFEVLPGRGKGDHVILAKTIICKDGERHTAKVVIDATAASLHPKVISTICARAGLTKEKLKAAIKGRYSQEQYERELSQIPKIELLAPNQRAGYFRARKQ